MNKLTVVLVVLTASLAFGSKAQKAKEPTSQLAENTLHVYRFSSGKSRMTWSAASSPTALFWYALITQLR